MAGKPTTSFGVRRTEEGLVWYVAVHPLDDWGSDRIVAMGERRRGHGDAEWQHAHDAAVKALGRIERADDRFNELTQAALDR